jgi:hypothetical protein
MMGNRCDCDPARLRHNAVSESHAIEDLPEKATKITFYLLHVV